MLTWSDTALGRNQQITDQYYYTVRYTPMLSPSKFITPMLSRKFINATDLNIHVDNLKADTEYEFFIKVIRDNRQSTWSLSVFNKTRKSG